MDPERWGQIDRVLQAALAVEDGERRAYLDEVCAGDAELREAVEAMLASDATVVSAAETPAVESGDEWAVGRLVGPYRIEALLGKGGMGAVYLAHDDRLGRAVAIKVVASGANAGLIRRFTLEALAASALNHPNIVTVHDVGGSGALRYMVTEYVDGEVLRARMRREMTVAEAVDVARQVASALSAAHAAGVVHRDIKPENVMVRGDGLVKVLDFGIAKLVEGAWRTGQEIETEVATEPGMRIGTCAYMSPEQARAEEVDGRTDVWSLGVLLYEMLAGRKPFRGPTRMDALVAVMKAEPELVAGIPWELSEVIVRALRKRAEERYQTAEEMAAALDEVKRRLAADGATTNGRNEARTGRRPAAPTNLPEEREPLIGRERELRAIVEELRGARLLTLTGPGGTGKTRLAAEAGRALLTEFVDGVYFVDLAAIRDPALVASTVARALDVKEAGGTPIDETLLNALGGRELLLVLDNFEQVVDAAPFVARLLTAPRLKVLVTSRERLRVSAEQEYPLSPLVLPPSDRVASGTELARYGSVELLVRRARAVHPTFELEGLSEAGMAAVAEICRRLDGLPLAIELAAARLRILTPEALLGKLDRQLKLLVGGARDMPERQQTMRAAIAWSYDLLEQEERRLFERLSVFSGGWTMEAAEGLDPDEDILDLLARLTERSLVMVERHGEDVRYRMLETIRQYAVEKLGETGEEARTRSAHADWFVTFAERADAELEGPNKAPWLVRLDREQENVRSALEWSGGEGLAPVLALRLAAAMGRFWSLQGLWSEGGSWLERALAGAEVAPSRPRATALFWIGKLSRRQSNFEHARETVAESMAMRRELGDLPGTAQALGELGMIADLMGAVETAEALLHEALALYEELGDDSGRVDVITFLSHAAYARNDFDAAEAATVRALEIYRALDDRSRIATGLYNLGVFARRRRDFAAATELLEESLALAREFDERPLVARAIHFLGNVAGGQQDYGRAARLRAEAARAYLAMGDGYMLLHLFDDVVAEALARELPERAARLFGAVLRFEETGALPTRSPGDTLEAELLASVRGALGETETELAMAKGRGLSVEQALELACDD